MGSEVRPWMGLQSSPPNGNGAAVTASQLPQHVASFLAGGVGGKAKLQAGGRQLLHLFSHGGDRHRPQKPNEVYTCTEFFSGSNGALARCAKWQPKPTGAVLSRDHGSKSQHAGTEKRAGERYLPSRSDSNRKGTHHIVKRPDQAGIRVPAVCGVPFPTHGAHGCGLWRVLWGGPVAMVGNPLGGATPWTTST